MNTRFRPTNAKAKFARISREQVDVRDAEDAERVRMLAQDGRYEYLEDVTCVVLLIVMKIALNSDANTLDLVIRHRVEQYNFARQVERLHPFL